MSVSLLEAKDNFIKWCKSFLNTHVDYKKDMPFDIDFVTKAIWEKIKNDYENLLYFEEQNAAMRERLEKAAVPPCKIGDVLYTVTVAFADGWVSDTIIRRSAISLSETVVTEKNIWRMCELIRIGKAFFSKEAAEAKLKELQGGKE